MIEPAREVALARGLIDETGARHRRVLLRPLNGWQEWSLAAAPDRIGAAEVHALLASCIERLGGYSEIDTSHTAALSRGDRARLALELRSLLFEDRLPLTQRCPNPDCRELADLDLFVSQLLGEPGAPEPEWFDVATEDGPARVRPPTGLDEEISMALPAPPEQQAALLWSRITGAVGDQRGLTAEDWLALRPATRQAIAMALADGEAAPDLTFLSRCPACAGWLELEINPFDLLTRELRRGADRLLAEVHCIAFHYSWSEDTILALPRSRRWRYLELLRDQIEGRPLNEGWG
ncbi:MAG: hypothetical protein JSS43_24895 [Proteobacteria bacterium]|nr:hypothetical protein [Pseudomonadota bacterium]